MLNVTIAARNEYPQIVWTIYSIINDIPEGEDYQIILVSNGEATSDKYEQRKKMDKWLSEVPLSKRGILKVISLDEPINTYKAFQLAIDTYDCKDILMYCCAHIAVERGTLAKMLDLVRQDDVGLVHSPMLYMGGMVDKTGRSKLYGYNDPIGQGWNWTRHSDRPYRWHGGGGALSMIKLSDWSDIKAVDLPLISGYDKTEMLLDMKMWMFGKSVWIHPDCLYYHWAKSRGYSWTMGQFYYNAFLTYYSLGGEEFLREMNSKEAYPQPDSFLEKVMEAAEEHRQFILGNAKWTLNEVLQNKPWLEAAELQQTR